MWRRLRSEELVDDRFMKKLDQSGFIDEMYREVRREVNRLLKKAHLLRCARSSRSNVCMGIAYRLVRIFTVRCLSYLRLFSDAACN